MHSFKYIFTTIGAITFACAIVVILRVAGTPCEWEDSTNCHWIATDRGNGHGTSFIDVLGVTIPLP